MVALSRYTFSEGLGMFDRIFAAHPRALGETYFTHQRAAFSYAGSLIAAGLAAAIHGIIPCLFETTGSRAVARLHGRMSARLGQDASGRLPAS
jgi:hypothetical protein